MRVFTFNRIDVNEKRFGGIDGKRLNVVKEQKKKKTILKPDKGQGVLLLKLDYTNYDGMLLTYRNKFKGINNDVTIMRLNTVQYDVNKSSNRGEINEEQKKLMRPKAA